MLQIAYYFKCHSIKGNISGNRESNRKGIKLMNSTKSGSKIIRLAEGHNTSKPEIFNSKNKVIASSLTTFEQNAIHSGISIKYVVEGEEEYRIDGKRHLLKAGQFLIVNSGQQIDCSIESKTPTVGMCFYIDERLARNRYWEYTSSSDQQLDQDLSKEKEIVFRNIIHNDCTVNLGKVLKGLNNSISLNGSSLSQLFYDELFYYQLTDQLLKHHCDENSILQNINTVKQATKEELYKRIQKSIDYMHQHLDSLLPIKKLAEIAFISEFHFIRIFKQFTQMTPNQYLNELRLNRSRTLLQENNLCVKEIAYKSGFNSPSSFGREFKRRFNQTPLSFRKSN